MQSNFVLSNIRTVAQSMRSWRVHFILGELVLKLRKFGFCCAGSNSSMNLCEVKAEAPLALSSGFETCCQLDFSLLLMVMQYLQTAVHNLTESCHLVSLGACGIRRG